MCQRSKVGLSYYTVYVYDHKVATNIFPSIVGVAMTPPTPALVLLVSEEEVTVRERGTGTYKNTSAEVNSRCVATL